MEQAYDFLMKEVKIKYGDPIVVAVSGGPDSMALLHMLTKIKKALNISVICAHVNHNVRSESEEEKVFVEKFCTENNVIFEYMKIDNYGDDNFHNEARSKRYNFFSKVVKKHNAKYLLTAHHGDDLIETILMRIVRGSTLKGYSGFSKIVNMEEYTILRPLIHVTKDEIITYLKNNKIKYAQDLSNNKDVYTRNRFRKNIVPLLKKEDKHVNKKFYKFSKNLLEYNDYIDKEVSKIINIVYPTNVLNIEEFLKQEHIIQIKIIYFILEKIYQDDLMLITDAHTDLVYEVIKSKKANLEIHLPNNIKVIKAYNNVTFIEEKMDKKEYEIEIIKHVNLPNGKNLEVVEESDLKDNNVCRLSSSDVKLPLHVRSRKDGDRIYIKGMMGSKKVKDIFIDKKIPMEQREVWPIVVDTLGTIVWIPGLKKSKNDKQKGEKCDIIIKYY